KALNRSVDEPTTRISIIETHLTTLIKSLMTIKMRAILCYASSTTTGTMHSIGLRQERTF
ncbi:hypothetical protein Q9L58_010759, partial [Maublancomyces gigas]